MQASEATDLTDDLVTWIIEEEQKWAAEIAAQISLDDSNLPENKNDGTSDHGCNGRRFPSNSNLYRHQRGRDSSRAGPHCWDHGCNGRQFSSNSNLHRHQREQLAKQPAVCPRCKAEFKPAPILPPTQTSRTTPQCWEHGCNGRTFSHYSSLLRHYRHKQAQGVTCPSCSEAFSVV